MSRVDEIKLAVERELELRRSILDGDPALRSVLVTVYMDRRSGRPMEVELSIKSQALLMQTAGVAESDPATC
ncbi:MAG: hypothetical protein AB1609_21400 [Bacillota bacterium]